MGGAARSDRRFGLGETRPGVFPRAVPASTREEEILERSGMHRFKVGSAVNAEDGPVGTLEEVITDERTGDPAELVVRDLEHGQLIRVPAAVATPGPGGGEIKLSVARASLRTEESEPTTIALHEEVLEPTKREIDLGQVVFHKRVETVPAQVTVDLTRDDVRVERVPVNRPIQSMPAPRQEGDTFIVPVVEEVLFTEKRLLLREEIRITRGKVHESRVVSDTVRREVVEIEERPIATVADQATGTVPRVSAPGSEPVSSS